MLSGKSQFVALVILAALMLPFVYIPAGAQTAQHKPPYGALRPQSGKKLIWQTDIRSSLQMAKRSQKLVLVDVYTDWCGWCKRLDRDTYSDPSVVSFIDSRFVPLRLDAEDKGEGEKFARKHNIQGYPCTLVMDGDGKLRGLFYGYRKPNDFPAELSKASGG